MTDKVLRQGSSYILPAYDDYPETRLDLVKRWRVKSDYRQEAEFSTESAAVEHLARLPNRNLYWIECVEVLMPDPFGRVPRLGQTP